MHSVNPDLAQRDPTGTWKSRRDSWYHRAASSRYCQKQLAHGKSQTMNSRYLTGHALDVVVFRQPVSWGNFATRCREKSAAAFRLGFSWNWNIPVEWAATEDSEDGPHFQATLPEPYPA